MRIGSLATLAACAALIATVTSAAPQYTYDQLGRLQSATYDNGVQIIYNYDAAGNRTSVSRKTSNTLGPVANACSMTAFGVQTASCNAIARAVSPQGLTLTISSVGSSSHGGTTGFSGQNVTYIGNNVYFGPDSFSFTIKDTNNRTSTATAFVNVTAGNPPIANNDSYQTAANAAITFNPTLNDVEPIQGNQIHINSLGTVSNGTLVNNGSNSLTYTPNTGFFGNDGFTYNDNDGAGQVSNTASVAIQVGSPPTAVADIVGSLTTGVTFDPRVNDSDPNGGFLLINGIGTGPLAPSHGNAMINPIGTKITYTPYSGFTGKDTFTYYITDGPFSASAVDTVCVQPALPVANNPTMSASGYAQPTGKAYAGGFVAGSGTIACNVGATVTQVNPGQNGSTWTDGSIVHWTSNQELAVGTDINNYDSFTYVLTDPFGNSATGTVTVNVQIYCQGCIRTKENGKQHS